MRDLLEPLTLSRGPAWSNRLALAPLTNKQSHDDGTLSDDEHEWLLARARGGFGLVMTAAAHVSPEGQAWRGQLGVSDDRHVPALTRLADDLRAAGAVSSVQLHHGGRRADPEVSGLENVAPWADPARGTRALATGEVGRVVDDFVAAAVRCRTAGFDGVQVHGAHGYLLGQFLDGRHNQRTDGWGGSLVERSRIMHTVLSGIRAATGEDFQVGLRLTPEGSGVLLPEALVLAEEVLTSGVVDHLDVSLWDVRREGPDGPMIDAFTALPRGGTRLGVAGKVLSAADARWCLEHGADFVTIGTAAIIHHDLPQRVAADPGFTSTPQPVTREHLAAESVGPRFVDYLATQWDDFVS